MAEAINTLAGLVQLNNLNNADLNVSDLLQDAPLIAAIAAVEASNGTNHSYLKETVAEGVAFRAPNAGVINAASQDEEVQVALTFLDGGFDVDVAIANKYKDGPEAYLEKRVPRKVSAMLASAESNLIYGAVSGGFAGLLENTLLNSLSDSMVIGAGGTTADVNTSVLFLRSDEDNCALIAGNDGRISVDEPFMNVVYPDPTTDAKRYDAWRVPVNAWLGMQYGSIYSVARIANLNATDAGKTMTDDLAFEAIALFPSARQPNLCVMNRQSLEQLRSSRTATNDSGAPAPTPVSIGGIPIVVTDSIVNTEAIVS